METLTYHGNISEKRATLKQLRDHRSADQIIQGTYWTGNGSGKGCAVGCLTHAPDGGHDQFPDRWGVPVQLAYLIDHIFESLPTEDAVEWPVRIMAAIPVGADLSRVWDQWSAWMLHSLVAKASEGGVILDPSVEVMASLFDRAGAGDEPVESEWVGAARAADAADAAEAAEAAWAARAAEAARAARAADAAEAAEAAWAARAAEAARAARAADAAEAADAARAARARHDWAHAAADQLVRLVKAAA